MLKIKKLTKKYGKRVLFSDFSYDFPDTGLIALIGESGSGKSTLLNLISGIDLDYGGSIEIDEANFKKMSLSKILDYRVQNIGYVFQNFNLLNLDSVAHNVYFPLDTICNDKEALKKQRTTDALNLVGMNHKAKVSINKLSGGEKQRVAIARALVNNPKIILCDEPTGALDEKNSEIVFNLLKRVSKNTLVIVATHDKESAAKIADKFIVLENEKLRIIEGNSQENTDISVLVKSNEIKKKPKVTTRFKLRFAYQKMKAKKYRSLILNLLLSLSLTGVGLSLILTNSVSQKVEEAFGAMLNGNQIVVSRRNENENTFTNTYSTSYKNVYKIYEKYQYLLDGIGVNYMVNFENFFKDNNEFYAEGKNKKIPIESLSARSINDFKWIPPDSLMMMYPFSYDYIDNDQIVLALSYEDMVNLCFSLQIQRNYTSLGHFIYEQGLMLSLNVRNNFWQYDDEQILNVVAVCESKETFIMHTNLLWNEYMFEEMMRIPSDDDEVHELPWEMYKIYYLQSKEDPSVFIDATIIDKDMSTYVFERTNYKYNSLLCKSYDVCDAKKIYVYSTDKKTIMDENLQNYLDANKGCLDFYYTSDFGYASYSSNLFSGFSRNVFLSTNKDSLDIAIDADNRMESEQNFTLNLPEDVVQGNFMLSLAGGLRFSSDMTKLKYGRKPTNLNEIVISKGLAEKYDKESLLIGKYVEIAGEIEEYYDSEDHLCKVYNSTKLLVVGVVEETGNYLYHSGYWTISFFRDKLGVSNFLLIPKSVVIEYPTKSDAEKGYQELKNLITDYKVISPIDDLKKNIEVTLDYANTILVIFSALSLIISVLFLGTVIMLNILESKNDVSLFTVLGIRKRQIDSMFVIQSLLQGLISFIVSSIELLFVDIFLSFAINKSLGIAFKFSFNSKPFLVIFMCSVLVPFLVTKIMLLILSGKKSPNKSKIF